MQPSELADHIAALDWSGTSLQHQLAMAAAVETLRGGCAGSELENPVGELRNLLADLINKR